MIPPGLTTVGNLVGPMEEVRDGIQTTGDLWFPLPLQETDYTYFFNGVVYNVSHFVSLCLPLVWCCVDKDGTLSLPNPQAETFFSFGTSRCSVDIVHVVEGAEPSYRRRQKMSLMNCSRTELVLKVSLVGNGSKLVWLR